MSGGGCAAPTVCGALAKWRVWGVGWPGSEDFCDEHVLDAVEVYSDMAADMGAEYPAAVKVAPLDIRLEAEATA